MYSWACDFRPIIGRNEIRQGHGRDILHQVVLLPGRIPFRAVKEIFVVSFYSRRGSLTHVRDLYVQVTLLHVEKYYQ